jgi:starch-binding outer membrane protein, SusD/RagB family
MRIVREIRGLGALVVLGALAACNSLDIQNPNEPDTKRALGDPTAMEAVAAGAFRTWFNAATGLRTAGVLSTQARALSSSWNNGNMNFYSSIYQGTLGVRLIANDTVTSPTSWSRAGAPWQNDPSAAGRTSVLGFWTGGLDETATNRPGFYSALAAANTALIAIRKNGALINGDAARTKRTEAIALFMQGASLMMISLNYDRGFIVDENTPLDPNTGKPSLSTLDLKTRKEVRDAAVAKLTEAAALASANVFTTDAGWANGVAYSNTKIAQIANTMAAMTLAWYPRDASENAAVNWAQVATLASAGMSVGSPVEFGLIADGYSAWVSEVIAWFCEIDGGKVHTRVMHFVDPATQIDPFLIGTGSAQPNSPDKRVGDGSFGDDVTEGNFGTIPKTANAGTDFSYDVVGEWFRPDRGFYHQSNWTHIRYDESGLQDPNAQYGGFGWMPVISSHVNDLIWAEALLRKTGRTATDVTNAAALINKTRVTRGGLSSALLLAGNVGSDADGPCMTNAKLALNGAGCTMFSELLYEYELELLNLGPWPYFHQRHVPVLISADWEGSDPALAANRHGIFNGPRYIQGLLPGTPRDMPVPYQDLGLKGELTYTFGGTYAPNSTPP